jgi:predicted phosphoribosyltransferase
VASHQAAATLGHVADRVIALERPDPFLAVGRWYRRFDQVSDDQVVALLAGAHPGVRPSPTDHRGAAEPGAGG